MDEDKGVALQQLKLLGEIKPAIIKEFLKNSPKTGYVFTSVDSSFNIVEGPRFIQREIKKEDFANLSEKLSQPEKQPEQSHLVQEKQWVYYEINWLFSRTSWHLKEQVNPS